METLLFAERNSLPEVCVRNSLVAADSQTRRYRSRVAAICESPGRKCREEIGTNRVRFSGRQSFLKRPPAAQIQPTLWLTGQLLPVSVTHRLHHRDRLLQGKVQHRLRWQLDLLALACSLHPAANTG